MDDFDRFYSDYLDRLYSYCLYRVRDRATAEDLAAAAFMKFLEAGGLTKPNPAGYLFTIARNLVVDHYRQRKATVTLDDAYDLPETEGFEKNSETRLLYEYVLSHLEALPEEQREAILLHYVNDLDLAAVASGLGKSVPATKALLHRGVTALREIIQKKGAAYA